LSNAPSFIQTSMRFRSQVLKGCCPRGGMGDDVETNELYRTLYLGLSISIYPLPGLDKAAYDLPASRFKFPSGVFPEWQPDVAQFVVRIGCMSAANDTCSITSAQTGLTVSPLL